MTVTIENLYTGNGSTTDYSFTFPYLDTTDIKVSLATVNTTAYSLLNATTVRFNSAPGNGVAIRIYRETAFDTPKATFYPGSAIRANDLNDNTLQNLYVNQESNDKVADAWLSGDPTVISSETWYTTDDTKVATTKAIEGRIDVKIDTALTTDVVAGNKVTITDNSPSGGKITVGVTSGSLVNSDVNASAAIAGTKIAPNFGSQNIVTSGTAATGAATVTGNIAVSGTVDGRDVAADGTKLDGIESGATADQSNAEIRTAVEAATDSNVFTDADHTKLNAIEASATRDQTAAEIRTAVEAASDSNVFTDADHTKLNAIEASATADQTDAEIRAAVEAATNSNVFTDADHTKLNAIEASATADQTVGEIKSLIAGSPLDASHLAANSVGDSEIATGALDNRYYTETELNAGQLDNRYYTETESDARYFNISTGDTIKDGDTFPDNDTTIATTAAINDRIIDLVDDVGGFVPIANETSFPNANPDVNNGAGTLISIKALSSNLTSNGSGVATIANGTVGNSTVTITGLANSTTYSSAYGMIVETTTTLNTYTFHRQVPIATEVTTVATNISNVNTVGNNISNVNTVAGNNSNVTTVAGANSNITAVAGSISNVNTVATNISNVNDFSDKYRVASSAPTSSLDTGDLYFDTTANELKVYNGSAWQGGVTNTSNLAGLGANTFTGHQKHGDNIIGFYGSSDDLKIYHNGTDGNLKCVTGDIWIQAEDDDIIIRAADDISLQVQNGENGIQITGNGDVDLYYDGSKKLETTSYGTLFTGNSKWVDNGKATFGDGDDLQIFHNGSTSYIKDNGTGSLIINSVDGNIHIRVNDTEESVKCIENAAVELYFDGSKKFETTASGFTAYGDASTGNCIQGDLRLKATNSGTTLVHWNPENSEIRWDDSYKASFGDSADLQIYHDGTHNYIQSTFGRTHLIGVGRVQIQTNNGSNTENSIVTFSDGAVHLYYDNSVKFETTSSGAIVNGNFQTSHSSNNDILLNAGDGSIEISRSGSGAFIDFKNSTSEDYDLRLSESSGALSVTGDIRLADSKKFIAGTGSDLQIYHDGGNSWIKENGTGILFIDTHDGGHIRLSSGTNTDTMANFYKDSEVQLHYDGVEKLNTYSSGVAITGDLIVSSELNLIGSSDANKYLDARIGTNSFHIRKVTGGDAGHEVMAYFKGDAECALYYDGSKKVETVADGINVHGAINFQNSELISNHGGSSNIDHIWHNDGTNTWNFCSDTTNRADGNSKVKCGSVEDSKGDLRKIPINATTSSHTLIASDAGKCVTNTTGGVTVPQSVFSPGDAVTIINHSGSDITITQQSGVNLYNTADGSTGNRTLAARGMATVFYQANNIAYITGAGLS